MNHTKSYRCQKKPEDLNETGIKWIKHIPFVFLWNFLCIIEVTLFDNCVETNCPKYQPQDGFWQPIIILLQVSLDKTNPLLLICFIFCKLLHERLWWPCQCLIQLLITDYPHNMSITKCLLPTSYIVYSI